MGVNHRYQTSRDKLSNMKRKERNSEYNGTNFFAERKKYIQITQCLSNQTGYFRGGDETRSGYVLYVSVI